MQGFKPFDILKVPLNGTNLIEASAGTGKTYTITGLYLRLIVEKGLHVDQILVVTFTKAATEELKQRIRSRLLEARRAFDNGSCRDVMLDRAVQANKDPVRALNRIKDALRDFDSGAIFTIHGFCQRILHENAFETGSLFDTDLMTDQRGMLQSICGDYWRRMLYDAAPEFVGFTLPKIKGPEALLALLNKSNDPELRIIPQMETEPLLNSLEAFRASSRRLSETWPGAKEAVRKRLMDAGLNAGVYGSLKPGSGQSGSSNREKKVGKLLMHMDGFCEDSALRFPLFKDFEKLTAAFIEKKTKKNHAPPRHAFFELCDTLNTIGDNLTSEMNELLLFKKTAFFNFAKEQLALLKDSRNVQYFDDLLTRLRDALEKPSGNLLADSVRSRFHAALVDEFQDTDMLQYGIFSRLFSGKKSLLFMIGDPKQAIYGFRGADIFSYLKASADTRNRYTLQTNYRSSAGLITAVNTLFSRVDEPFVFNEIPFLESTAAQSAETRQFDKKGPFRLWFTDTGQEKPQNKTDAVYTISRAVSAEISRLIHGVSDMNPGDIAVLVRTNLQADIVKQHLSAVTVPAVIYSAGNVFETREARDIYLVLLGISDPLSDGRFRAALATRMLGVDGEVLDLEGDVDNMQAQFLSRFLDYRRIWLAEGFMRMFNLFLSRENVRARLLAMKEGQRRLTNVLQLAELLHTCASQKKLGMEGLLDWLSIQRDPDSEMPETHQLRLESDDLAVKIITIHKSKGLEFPVVFCPFSWGSSKITGTGFTFHDPEADRRLTLDLGSAALEDNRQLARYELLAENLRLLYVALTRARNRCYLVWGRINDVDTSALSYLLHYREKTPDRTAAGLLQEIEYQYRSKDRSALFEDLKKLATSSEGTIVVSDLPVDGVRSASPKKAPAETLSRRTFNKKIDRSWRVSSYSSLISGRMPDNEMPDRDEHIDLSVDETLHGKPTTGNDLSIFTFPKGASAGVFFHDIFEHLDFVTADEIRREALVIEKMNRYGFKASWKDAVLQMIERVLRVRLDTGIEIMSLASIPNQDRINEMAFYFPLNEITTDTLRQVFETHDKSGALQTFSEHLGRLHFAPTRGFMKGFIDLVFTHNGRYYLVDWKSNYLGASPADYAPKQLAASMERSFYVLQYHLYTLALHLFLQLRLPGYCYEKNFGGVFYIFIRGVDPGVNPDTGVFFDCPPKHLMQALGKALIPGYGKK